MVAFDLAFDSDREHGFYFKILGRNENFQPELEE